MASVALPGDDPMVVGTDPGRMDVILRNSAVYIAMSYAEAMNLHRDIGAALGSLQEVKDGPPASRAGRSDGPLSYPGNWKNPVPSLDTRK